MDAMAGPIFFFSNETSLHDPRNSHGAAPRPAGPRIPAEGLPCIRRMRAGAGGPEPEGAARGRLARQGEQVHPADAGRPRPSILGAPGRVFRHAAGLGLADTRRVQALAGPDAAPISAGGCRGHAKPPPTRATRLPVGASSQSTFPMRMLRIPPGGQFRQPNPAAPFPNPQWNTPLPLQDTGPAGPRLAPSCRTGKGFLPTRPWSGWQGT